MRITSRNLLNGLVLALCCAGTVHVGNAQVPTEPIVGEAIPCINGKAAVFDCKDVELLSFLPISHITSVDDDQTDAPTVRVQHQKCHYEGCASGGYASVRLNDVWGWTDDETGKEYAIVGRVDGTSFVDISDPSHPVFAGDLPMTEGSRGSTWRDMKVYRDHVFIVADNAGEHGMQVFDLRQLRSLSSLPARFTETALYRRINSAHNIVINTETGFAYTVGNSGGGETCGGGLHMIDIREPSSPEFAGCFSDPSTGRMGTGYTHDAQCVLYHGPDQEHQGREICFGSNETALSIADVSDKARPVALSSATYPSVSYTHQGWITDDHRYFFVNDELDELSGGVAQTRTLIWDVVDLDDPQLVKEYTFGTESSDHNLYVRGGYMYQSNYGSGLRIHDISDPENPVEIGYFDTTPVGGNGPGFNGAWSNYPFFESGTVLVSSIGEGLFILKPAFSLANPIDLDEVPVAFGLSGAVPNPMTDQTTLVLDVPAEQAVRIAVYDMLGREVAMLFEGRLGVGTHPFSFSASTLPSGRYVLRAVGDEKTETQVITIVR